jgi:hypothetical protein
MIAKKTTAPALTKCQMCSDYVKRNPYRYKPTQFVPDWEPEEIIVCKKCIYREVYGSKNYRKKMKEGTLDG